MSEQRSVEFCSKAVRLAFVSVWEPKQQPGNSDKKKYEVTALITKTDTEGLKPFKIAALNAIVNKWGEDRKKWPANLRTIDFKSFLSLTGKDGWPFRDGDAMPYDGFAGNVAIKCANERKVTVVDISRNPIIDNEEMYSGCFGQLIGVAYAWDNSGNRGVSFSLDGVRKLKDGDPFVRRASLDSFEGYDDMAEAAGQDFGDPGVDF